MSVQGDHTHAQPCVTLVGCGNMGSALLKGWLNSIPEADYGVINPTPLAAEFQDHPQIKYASKAKDLIDHITGSEILVLAIKPQFMQKVCSALGPLVPKETLVLSIAAGQTIASLESYFGENQPVVRCIPNLPAAIGKGMTVAVTNAHATDAQKALAHILFAASGLVEWIEDENLMNAASAVSGSGPAFVFLLVEILAKASENSGAPPEMAMLAARQTVIGAAGLLESNHEKTAQELRQNVTSPGGITEAALKILMSGETQSQFDEAIKAAIKRAEELNS